MPRKKEFKKNERNIMLIHIQNYEATIKISKALLADDQNITSAGSEIKFLTTRIANPISGLRKSGIDIETKTVKVPGTKKHYGKYVLVQKEENIKKLILLLEELEEKVL